MKTTAFLLLFFVHLVAFTQFSPKHTSRSFESLEHFKFLNAEKKHMGNYDFSKRNIPDFKVPLNTEFKQLKSKTLEKIKQKEKSQNERLLKVRESLSNSLNQEISILDSLHVYSFSSPTDSLLTVKIFFMYSETGENISFYTSELDTLTHLWQFLYKEDYYPDQLGRDTLQVYYNWDVEMNDWMPESKYEKSFDDFGNDIRTAFYNWENSIQKWVGEFKTENAYDEFGNQTYFVNYSWDIALSEWIGMLKYESEFDEHGNQIASSEYHWVPNLNIWRGSSKYVNEIRNDENGIYQSNISFVWDEINKQWKEYYKYENALNISGKNLYEASYYWNVVTGNWKGDSKSEHFYVEDSQDFDLIYYSWSDVNTDWMNSEKSEIRFNELGNILNTRSYVWVETMNEWKLYSKVDNFFNELGLLEESVESSLNDTIVTEQLIKGFDSIEEEIVNIIGDISCENKSCLTVDDEYTEGAGAVNWNYDVSGIENWGGFSQIHLSNSVNMEGDDGIFLFYKNVIPSEARFFLIFLESSGEEWRYEDNFILADTATGWQQFVVPFENFFIPYFRTPVNGIFELDAIETIQIQLYVPSGDTAMGSVSLDNFSTFKYEKTEDWIIGTRQQLAYDIQGKLLSDSIFHWDNNLNVLAPKYYAVNTYDHNGYLTSHESYNWEYNFMDWIGYSKYERILNDQGHVTSSVFYEWDYGRSDWVALQKNDISYNEQNLESGYTSYYWDKNSGIWIGTSKGESIFDLFGNRISHENYLWNYAENEWNSGYKTEWHFVDNKELALHKNYEWDASAGDWKVTDSYYYTKWEEIFNERGNVEMEISKQWDENLTEWTPVEKYFYFYSEPTTDLRLPELQGDQIAVIYPNPARDFVNIRLNSDSQGTANLMDFKGRIIKKEILSGSLKSIPLHDFSPGIYIVQIKTDRKVFTQKLVISN